MFMCICECVCAMRAGCVTTVSHFDKELSRNEGVVIKGK